MWINKTILFGLFFLCQYSLAQTFAPRTIKGKVYSKDGDVSATHVMNISTKKATITDIEGFFSITASLNDTLVFSAVQFKRKEIVLNKAMLESTILFVPLEEALNELDEVIVRPYGLSGDLGLDAKALPTDFVVTASTLGLPNAYVKPLSKSERALFAATANPFMSFDPLINAITGRTKMLKKQVKLESTYARTERVRLFYPDSLYVADLKIPLIKIDDFMYFCEVDAHFQALVDSRDKLQIWEYMRKKSVLYRKNNGLE